MSEKETQPVRVMNFRIPGWTVGFLFSIGTGVFDSIFENATEWYEMVAAILGCYIFWPVILGDLFGRLVEKL